jgi:hypothetical protein
LAVELPDGLFGKCALGVLDKRETAGAPGLAVERPHDLGRAPDLRKMGSQVVVGGLIGQIAYEQSNWWHGLEL